MVKKINIENYLVYLNFIQSKLNKYFESQNPFIFCKKGCALCCKKQLFPYSHIEAEYLLIGISQLPSEKFNIVEKNINDILFQRKETKDKYCKYDCPFLINDSCSIYEYRGIVCRAFGLMINTEGENLGVPFCCFKGLNYSNVINLKTREISKKKYDKLKTTKTPNSYNVSYEFLVNDDFAKSFGFKFGEIKPMIDWLEFFQKEAGIEK